MSAAGWAQSSAQGIIERGILKRTHTSIRLPLPHANLFFLCPSFALDVLLLFPAPLCALPRPRAGSWRKRPSADHIAPRVDIYGTLGMDGGLIRQAYSPETSGDNRSGIIIGIVAVCWVLATIAVALRVYTRKVLLNQIGADDYSAAASLVSLFLFIYGSGSGCPVDSSASVGFSVSIGHRRSTQSVPCIFSI